MQKSARLAALVVLERCRKNQSYSDALLASVLETADLPTKDRALVTRLCYGVLQNELLLDYYIDYYAEGRKIEPKVRGILRLSAYQLVFMDKIPPHAAVSEGVELCKKTGLFRASGFVNAILRRMAESRDRLPEISAAGKTEFLSIKYSVPLPLAELLVSDFGSDFTEQYLTACNEPAPANLQVNTIKTTTPELKARLEKSGLSCREHEFMPDCLVLDGGNPMATEEFTDGLFYVQDCAARLSVMAAAPRPGMKVFDCCAAPGGKSFAAAFAMGNKGSITACDLHKNKLRLINNGAQRLGIDIITCDEADAAAPKAGLESAFDLVIADVPCSGLGVIRKKPDIRYKDIYETENLPKIQLEILEGVCSCVKPGGVLLYSTCTILRRENENVIMRFLAAHSEFSAESFTLPGVGEAGEGYITLYPQTHGTDGFFICKLRKNND